MDGRGCLVYQEIVDLIARGAIASAEAGCESRLQPASLDLQLGSVAYRIRASFLPGQGRTVSSKLQRLTLHEVDLTKGAVLETGCVYLVPLLERLSLPGDISALANPKSSTGRVDVFTRVIVDEAEAFDTVPQGYAGPLYLEISPRTFPVLLRRGSSLSQLRFRRGVERCSDDDLRAIHLNDPVVGNGAPRIHGGGLELTVDLVGKSQGGLVGFRAKSHAGVLDMDKLDHYCAWDFWDAIYHRDTMDLILDPDHFYILASREVISVPPYLAAEMTPFDPLVGEFRVHYAGFFDPGFGYGEGASGSHAVLEVRSREVPFILEHGQTVGRLVYERLTNCPNKLYGPDLRSHYQKQGLKLSRHFKDFRADPESRPTWDRA